MNLVCKTHIHPDHPTDMVRVTDEYANGKRIAVWRCPYPGCGNMRKQGLRGKARKEEPEHAAR
jgi:hypothetical protein